jgi:hypothetical protein
MSHLASIRFARGEMAAAQRLQEQVPAGMTDVPGAENPEVMTVANNLAATLFSLENLQGAERLFLQVLETAGRQLGSGHPFTTSVTENLSIRERLRSEAASQPP